LLFSIHEAGSVGYILHTKNFPTFSYAPNSASSIGFVGIQHHTLPLNVSTGILPTGNVIFRDLDSVTFSAANALRFTCQAFVRENTPTVVSPAQLSVSVSRLFNGSFDFYRNQIEALGGLLYTLAWPTLALSGVSDLSGGSAFW
jgi:hypothetical protein